MLLSRVVTRLGSLGSVGLPVIERLFSTDFVYLQELYEQINVDGGLIETQCPTCGTRFTLDTLEHSAHA